MEGEGDYPVLRVGANRKIRERNEPRKVPKRCRRGRVRPPPARWHVPGCASALRLPGGTSLAARGFARDRATATTEAAPAFRHARPHLQGQPRPQRRPPIRCRRGRVRTPPAGGTSLAARPHTACRWHVPGCARLRQGQSHRYNR